MPRTSLLLAAAFAAALGAAPARATDAGAASPRGKAYLVQVRGSGGESFTGCLFFARSGKLLVEGYGTLRYRFDELNDRTDAFQALNLAGKILGFYLSLHGTAQGANARTLTADALSSTGATYILQGVSDPSCKLTERAVRDSAGSLEWR